MRRQHPAFILWCNVYLDSSSDRAIVAQCFNHGGLQSEVAGEARLVEAADEVELGRETLAALNACRCEPSFNYRNRKKSDWPAYGVSGESSITRFEQRWRRFRVAGANDSNIVWELSIVLNEDYQLTMTVVVPQRNDPIRLGRGIRYLSTQAQRFVQQPETRPPD